MNIAALTFFNACAVLDLGVVVFSAFSDAQAGNVLDLATKSLLLTEVSASRRRPQGRR